MCVILAAIAHPTLNMAAFFDSAWAFSMYIESFAVFPQLRFFKAKNKEVEKHTAHFIAFQGVSKLFSMVFWIVSFGELNTMYSSQAINLIPRHAGYVVMMAQLL